jgi:hypothetical protein
MASERDNAKKAIQTSDSNEPGFDAALSEGKDLQHRLTIENNRHKEAMKDRDLGSLGKIFGNEVNAPIWIAGLVAFLGVFAAIFCIFQGSKSMEPHSADFWSKQSERCFAFSASALTFIFGRSGRK